jgi:two-component system phosphate regulon sensor histidine kinase PhoR
LLGPQFEKLPPVRLKRGQGLGGWVAEHGEPVIINDAYSDQRFFSHVDQLSGFRTRSMICIPLQVEQRTIGVLQAINRLYGKFTEHDLRLLQAIGAPLAAAIENANLHADVIAEKRRIETIFANMSEGLLTINAGGFITHANEAFLSLVSSDVRKVTGLHVSEVIRLKKGGLDEFLEMVQSAENENPQLAADLNRDNSRTIPVLISGAPIKKNDGSISELILVFSDLTQIREVEYMRDDFFHGIIHELRTPLATILMYARLLREGKVKQAEKEDRFLGVIERESDRLQKLVRQMLEMAKQEARELKRSSEPVRLNPVLEDALPLLADQAIQKGLLFRQRIQPDLPAVMGNPDTFHMILKNLVENAIKFTMSGTVQITAEADNGSVQIEIKDDGIGIPAEALPNLYKRFYRTQTAVERGIAGSGLGLYMVKQNLENYNGTISVESELGHGTTFTIRLPAV